MQNSQEMEERRRMAQIVAQRAMETRINDFQRALDARDSSKQGQTQPGVSNAGGQFGGAARQEMMDASRFSPGSGGGGPAGNMRDADPFQRRGSQKPQGWFGGGEYDPNSWF